MKPYILILALAFAISSCKSTKTKTESEQSVKIEYRTQTEYRDTGKVVTNTEIEYRTVYDTILKRYVEVKWRERVKIVENKDKSGKVQESGKIKTESKQSETIKTKPNGLSWWWMVLVGAICGVLAYRYIFK